MKKFILLLILILLLTFTLIGDCWVAGYDQRIKLTIDHTKIDDTLTNFPVTAFFTAAQAEEIFTEFDADEDFDRGQFALGDNTLLKAEKELFDVSESKAVYHVKIPSISPSVDTDYYFYYDNNADHNTSYIGATGSVTAAEVWVDYAAVYHMADATTSTILDSTSNSNDGTKKATNEPIEVVGKVGQGQDFDGTDDTISNSISYVGAFSFEWVLKPDTITNYNQTLRAINSWGSFTAHTEANGGLYVGTDVSTRFTPTDTGINVYVADTYVHMVYTYDGTNGRLYKNGSLLCGPKAQDTPNAWGGFVFGYTDSNTIDGIIDESRFYNEAFSAAWIKATYNTLWDSLLTYGSEETGGNALFWFNF